MWVLYFDQIEHDRFGTIRQQFWALLHYPLHVAILLTAEGSTLLIIWNEIVVNFHWMGDNLWDPSYFSTSQEFATSLVNNLTDFDNRFKAKELLDSYDYIAAANNITHFNLSTPEGFNHVEEMFNEMVLKLEVFLFENFNVEAPADAENAFASESDRFLTLISVFATVFLYFFIAGGCLLIILAILYWFGKTHKSRWEYGSVVVRATVGTALALVSISYLYNTGVNLFLSPWMIHIVTIVYFIGRPLLTLDRCSADFE
jgi:hypothetical protein